MSYSIKQISSSFRERERERKRERERERLRNSKAVLTKRKFRTRYPHIDLTSIIDLIIYLLLLLRKVLFTVEGPLGWERVGLVF